MIGKHFQPLQRPQAAQLATKGKQVLAPVGNARHKDMAHHNGNTRLPQRFAKRPNRLLALCRQGAMAFFIARGFIKTGLGRRIALNFVKAFGKRTFCVQNRPL